MELVCKVYWEMSREIRVEVPNEGLSPQQFSEGFKSLAANLAMERTNPHEAGAEYVPDSINCDPSTDVQIVIDTPHQKICRQVPECSCGICRDNYGGLIP